MSDLSGKDAVYSNVTRSTMATRQTHTHRHDLEQITEISASQDESQSVLSKSNRLKRDINLSQGESISATSSKRRDKHELSSSQAEFERESQDPSAS